MVRAAWVVCRKELLEALRDRRTLLLGVLLPVVIMPAVTLGLPYLAVREEGRLRQAPARVAVVGAPFIDGLLRTATAEGLLAVTAVRNPAAALRRGEIHAILEATRQEPGEPVLLMVTYDEGSLASLLARQKIDQAVARYSLAQVQARLAQRGITAERLLAVRLEHVSIREAAEAGRAQLALVLPFFIAVWILLGGQHAALDLGAGERERGTLPGLLLTPPDRLALVLGKFGTVFLLATGSVALVVATVLISLRLAPPFGTGLPPSMPWSATIALVGVGIAFAAFLSALQLLLSLAARSVREAQQFFTPLYLLTVGSVLLAQILPELGRASWPYLLPVVNAAYLLRGLLLASAGRVETALAGASLLASTMVILAGGAWIVRRERAIST